MSEAREQIKAKWLKIINSGVEFDSWGQVVEATEAYDKLASSMEAEEQNSIYTGEEKNVINKIRTCVTSRSKNLKFGTKGTSLDDIKAVKPVIQNLFTTAAKKIAFPVDVPGASSAPAKKIIKAPSNVEESNLDEESGYKPSGELVGSLQRPPSMRKGAKYIILNIEKIGLKQANLYMDPFLTISVYDKNRNMIGESQDTPVSNKKFENYIEFDTQVYIQTPLEDLPKNAAIFVEFKHYKPKEKRVSTKAWTFIESDEFKPGQVVAEIYAKPTDLSRKKIRLLSIKPLYLHLKFSLEEAD